VRRTVFILLTAIIAISLALAGCSKREGSGNGGAPAPGNTGTSESAASASDNASSNSGGSGNKKRITVYGTAADKAVQDVYGEIARAFMQENPDVEVDLQFPGSEYENILKVKMAANDLPDVWDTHGWAVIRYGNYLADLRDEEWVKDMTDTIRDVVTDESGKVHALVLAEANEPLRRLRLKGLDPDADYRLEPLDGREDANGAGAVYGGDQLMWAGLHAETGFGDFQSRLWRLARV
jgi:raffinose/stachyose/melibiose transport system substrate-binding protein